LRLARHLDRLAGDVVLPAVIRAAQAALLVPAEPEGDAPVRAELVDEAITPPGVAERQEPLRQELDPHRRAVVVGKLLREKHRLPVATEELPHGRPWTRLGQQLVDLGAQHGRLRPFASPRGITIRPLDGRQCQSLVYGVYGVYGRCGERAASGRRVGAATAVP